MTSWQFMHWRKWSPGTCRAADDPRAERTIVTEAQFFKVRNVCVSPRGGLFGFEPHGNATYKGKDECAFVEHFDGDGRREFFGRWVSNITPLKEAPTCFYYRPVTLTLMGHIVE